jgi:hypothetical protein
MYKPDVEPIGSKHVAVLYKQILFVLEHYCQAAECISSTWRYHTSKCNCFNRHGVSSRKTPAFISVVVRASSCRLHPDSAGGIFSPKFSLRELFCYRKSGFVKSGDEGGRNLFLMNGMQRVQLGYGFICLAFSSKPSSPRAGIAFALCISYWLLEAYCLMTLLISVVQRRYWMREMWLGRWWNVLENENRGTWRGKLPHCHSVYHKSHMTGTVVEHGRRRWHSGDRPSVPWHGPGYACLFL